MRTALFSAALTVLTLASPAAAQHDSAQHGARHSGYTNTEGVPTGLSASELQGLEAGAGLGLAKAAELHHYPGPKHVLELATELDLTPEQRATAETLRDEMLAQAVPLGEQIVDAERQLDALFENGTATPIAVAKQTEIVGTLQGRLRAVHLTAHIGMRAALTTEQVAAYDRLRGYTSEAGR